MDVSVETYVEAPPAVVWSVVTDIPNAAATIRAIESVEVLEPARGPSIVGLKWRETRTMFGKRATEVMWVTDAQEGSRYDTRAESHGAVYTTRVTVSPSGTGTRLAMAFGGKPTSRGAQVVWALTGFLFRRMTRKALQQDLQDIGAAAQARASAGGAAPA
ncbi:MAG TPA: SRPBCC family protein [Candidatus Thermoplasmatota archaeon]|nr:SRPBCC family protein [Candidatus Thermoplasmatota archaeon]